MNFRKIAFTLGLVAGGVSLLGMQQAYKINPNQLRGSKPAVSHYKTIAKVVSQKPLSSEESVFIRIPNSREFAVIALRTSDQETQKKAVEHLLATPVARKVFLSDIQNKDGAYVVDKLNQVQALVEYSNKRRLGLAADDEEKSLLKDRIEKSNYLFKISPYQEEFFSMSGDGRAVMRRMYTHFDPSPDGSVPASINLSEKEWKSAEKISLRLRMEFRTPEGALQAHRMPTTEYKVVHVARNVAQHTLLGVAPGAFGGWVGELGNELGNVVTSDQMRNTVINSLGQAAHSTLQYAVKNAEPLVLVAPKNEALHQLSQTITTFGTNFPNHAKNDLVETLTQKGPGIVGDAAVAALNNPGAILSGPSMVIGMGAGATYGLGKGLVTMNDPVETKNIPQI